MDNIELKLSKFMSYALRHRPDEFGLKLDEFGFCNVSDLLTAARQQKGLQSTEIRDIEEAVKNCKKQRFALREEQIKANYGHSFIVPKYEEKKPPAILHHGTNTNVVDRILQEGIKKMGRSFVHLSEGTDFAILAGQRRGEVVLLKVDAESAFRDGVKFYYADNEVWLSDFIPPQYVTRL